ncbi:MAG: geranylgeranyl reductase family protein [Bacteroidota bacterium]|nr:geranylgeranyl reductase family protein [Bacteroidota bacterium]
MAVDSDVIIAGAGPAGAVAAFMLASMGIRVLVIEKEIFPRYKVCGGGLTYRCLKELPVDISPVVESEINSIRFSLNFKDVFTCTSTEQLMVCTMRDRLDDYLISKAREAGAEVHFKEKITGIQLAGKTEIITDKQVYHTRMVIGADGASSIIARSAGLKKDLMKGLAWEAEIYPESGFLKENSHTVFLDWGTFPGGYGWVFPKKDHVSVGVGGPAILSQHMMPYYSKFIKYAGIEGNGITNSLRSWPIPVRQKKGIFHKGTIVVAGDAAGLSDPLTGEGICYAVMSGKIAAEACKNYLDGDPHALERYSEVINGKVMNELMEATRIKSLFNIVPGKIHRFVRDSDRAWRAMGKILRGERQYSDVKNGFKKWKVIWGAACRISGELEKIKERRFLRNGI